MASGIRRPSASWRATSPPTDPPGDRRQPRPGPLPPRATDGGRACCPSCGGSDVGLPKVVPLEEERLAGVLGERIGEAVAEIQPGRVTAFAEVVKGLAREMRVLDRHRLDHNANAAKQSVALLEDCHGELALDDDRELDEIPRGHAT